jgi:hypothetical protein
MFCRAYGANYLYGAAIQLWFLVPLRLRPDGQGSTRACIAYFVLGVIAGMCNEHTGPTLVLFAVGYALWRGRRVRLAGARAEAIDSGRPRLIWAGAVGCLVGFAAIFFAPGQDSRYEGLATKVSLVGRLLARGITSNLDIFRDWMLACAPVLGLIVIALLIDRNDIDRSDAPARHAGPLRLVGLALVAGTLITATVFVSPKLGPRFYLHGAALVLAGFIAVADHALSSARRLAPFVVLAVCASVYAGVRSLPLYYRLSQASADRLAALAAAPSGSVFTAESFEQVDDSWWFLGDDFRDVKKRELVAGYFDLRGVIFRAVDIDAPLGVSDVRLVPRYQVTPASCLDEHGGFEITGFRGLDVASIQHAMLDGVARTRARLGDRGRLDRLELAVELAGAPPALPRKTLLIGRWQPERFEAWAGAIERRGVGRTRSVVLPPALRGTDLEIFIYHLGGPSGGVARRLGTARDASLDYLPWARGGYWALACNADECFVIAAARVL